MLHEILIRSLLFSSDAHHVLIICASETIMRLQRHAPTTKTHLLVHDSLSTTHTSFRKYQNYTRRRTDSACRSHNSASVAERPPAHDKPAESEDGRNLQDRDLYLKARNRKWGKTAYLKSRKQHSLRLEEREKPLGVSFHLLLSGSSQLL